MTQDLFTWAATRTDPLPTIGALSFAGTNAPPELKRILRDYQTNARDKITEHFQAGHKRGMVVMATGAGKSVLFSAKAADTFPGRTLILTDQYDLVDQAVSNLLSTAGIYADVEQGGRKASANARVVVGTVQSMGNRLDQYAPDYFNLIVADECDRAIAPQWQRVLEHFDQHAHILGVTATPNRADRKPVLGYFEKKIYEISAIELINRGYLAPITVDEVPVTIDLSNVSERAGDYDANQLGHAVEAIFHDVCAAIRERAKTRRILVFTPNIKTSRQFVDVCHANGLNARHIDGVIPDREEIKQSFRDGEFQILSNALLLGRGYDDPGIDCVINLRPTKSLTFYQQMIGRGTRLFCPHGCSTPCIHPERKKDLLILDFMYQFKDMGPIRPSSLIAETPEQAKAMQRRLALHEGPVDIRDLYEQANTDIEENLIRAMMAAQKARGGKGEYFNAVQWAANLKVPDLVSYYPESAEEAEPVTERMLNKIRKAGIVANSVTCRGHAERIIAHIKARQEAGLASFKQVFWLRKWGIADPWNVSAHQAKRILVKRFRKDGVF